MARYKSLKPLLIAGAYFCMLMPVSSWADINYTFIKVNCDKAKKTVTFKMPYFENEDRNQLFSDVQKGKIRDLYEFDDMADKNQVIRCDLGNDQIVLLNAGRSNHRANDGLTIKLNGVPIGGIILANAGKVQLSVKYIEENVFSIKECSLSQNDEVQDAKCKEDYRELTRRELSPDEIDYIKKYVLSNKKPEGIK